MMMASILFKSIKVKNILSWRDLQFILLKEKLGNYPRILGSSSVDRLSMVQPIQSLVRLPVLHGHLDVDHVGGNSPLSSLPWSGNSRL